jgi:hypothetical protein
MIETEVIMTSNDHATEFTYSTQTHTGALFTSSRP